MSVGRRSSRKSEPAAARHRLRKGVAGTVFYLHGNRGNIDQCRWAIEPFLKAGYNVWIMDYRGFGKSRGPRSESALLADAQLVYPVKREAAGSGEELGHDDIAG